MFHGDVFICFPFFCKKLFNHVSLHLEVVSVCNWKSFLDMPRTHVHRSWYFLRGNTAPKVLAPIKNSTGPSRVAFPLKSQYVAVICKAAEKTGTGEDCKDEDVAGGEA